MPTRWMAVNRKPLFTELDSESLSASIRRVIVTLSSFLSCLRRQGSTVGDHDVQMDLAMQISVFSTF